MPAGRPLPFPSLESSLRLPALQCNSGLLVSLVLKAPCIPCADSRFHPRFGLDSTESFRSLDPKRQGAVRDLYRSYFFERQDDLWRQSGLKKLAAIRDASDMLIFGEDLGFIPSCVPSVLEELGILGLRIQRMPAEPGVEFGNPARYPYMAVASPSCHDVSPTRAWWEELSDRRAR